MSGTNPSQPHGAPGVSPPTGATVPGTPQRRSFLKEVAAVLAGTVTMLVPLGAGIATFLGPIFRPGSAPGGELLKVTGLDTLSDVPQTFKVVADRVDGWNTFKNEPVGAVYLQKLPDGTVRCFNVICPHAGCAVDYEASKKEFFCPCHNSAFALDGARSATSPSPRDLDTLEVDPEKLKSGEVWIKYQDFKSGTKEKHAT